MYFRVDLWKKILCQPLQGRRWSIDGDSESATKSLRSSPSLFDSVAEFVDLVCCLVWVLVWGGYRIVSSWEVMLTWNPDNGLLLFYNILLALTWTFWLVCDFPLLITSLLDYLSFKRKQISAVSDTNKDRYTSCYLTCLNWIICSCNI